MLILRRFMHRHTRSFFIPKCKQRDNPLNECEKPFFKKYGNPPRENPLSECEKSFVKKNVNPLRYNPMNECEKSCN